MLFCLEYWSSSELASGRFCKLTCIALMWGVGVGVVCCIGTVGGGIVAGSGLKSGTNIRSVI